MTETAQILVAVIIIAIMITVIIKRRKKFDIGKKYKNKVDIISGQQFEHFLSSLFYKMGYKNKVTKGSYDFGADLIVSNGRKRIVIQAKRYKSNVRIKAVQEVFSAMHYYDVDKAYVFTNSLYTKSARKLAQKLDVQLCDRNQIEALRKKYF